jgi:hypothetical protein
VGVSGRGSAGMGRGAGADGGDEFVDEVGVARGADGAGRGERGRAPRGWGQSGGREFGINGGSPGKDGVNTNERSSLVFSELRRVTCGVVVHKAVDNYRAVRITAGILWTKCGQEKNLK